MKTRDALVNGALEHIFEDPSSREFFEEWKSDPQLAEVHALASEWADNSDSLRKQSD